MYKFGSRSVGHLSTCHHDLQRVLNRVMSWQIMDFKILEGHRSVTRQKDLLEQGLTTVAVSEHNSDPSNAVDVAPYPIDWNDKFRFHILAGLFYAAAKVEDVDIRWGGDWDGDMSQKDHNFIDMPHYELK